MSVASWTIIFSFARFAFSANVGGSDFLARSTANLSIASVKSSIEANPFAATAYGKSKCPCVGIHGMEGYYATNMDFYQVQYPVDMGTSCFPWELTTHPDCAGGGGPEWCSQSWCWVDPCHCELEELPVMSKIGVTYQGSNAYFSYDTCGFLDLYTKEMSKDACVLQENQTACSAHSKCAWDSEKSRCGGKQAVETCKQNSQVDTSVHGLDDCRCVGVGGKTPGKAFMYINADEQVAYPPDVGSSCRAWESEVHPECLKDGKLPDWCENKWCFVDPCKCKTAVPPKMVMEENQNLMFQGKVAFWSAETCGNTDTWAAENSEKYCITQKTEEQCLNMGKNKKQQRCSWTGKECLGKALGGICAEQDATGILGYDGLNSGATRLGSFAAIVVALAVAQM